MIGKRVRVKNIPEHGWTDLNGETGTVTEAFDEGAIHGWIVKLDNDVAGVYSGVVWAKDVELEIIREIKRYSRWIYGPNDLPGSYSPDDQRANYGASYEDCHSCNYAGHRCPGCGTELNHDWTEGTEYGPERLHPDCWE